MRFADVTKVVGVVLLVVAAFSTSAVLAGGTPDPNCVQACADQYTIDKAACQATYDAAVALADQHEADCLNLPPADQPACLRGVDSERRKAKNAFKACQREAKQTYNSCVRACPNASPMAP